MKSVGKGFSADTKLGDILKRTASLPPELHQYIGQHLPHTCLISRIATVLYLSVPLLQEHRPRRKAEPVSVLIDGRGGLAVVTKMRFAGHDYVTEIRSSHTVCSDVKVETLIVFLDHYGCRGIGAAVAATTIDLPIWYRRIRLSQNVYAHYKVRSRKQLLSAQSLKVEGSASL